MPSQSEPVMPSQTDMLQPLPPELWPNIDHIQTEDGAPVDSVFSEKQMRLLTEPLYSSWKPEWPFVAFADVGLFYGVDIPPLVPNVLLSLKVRLPEDLRPKLNRSYFVWKYGKPPEVAIEIVSNKQGREDTDKLRLYADVRVSNYFIYDPDLVLSDKPLRGYQLVRNELVAIEGERFELPEAGLGLELWRGRYEDIDATWLRWIDSDGNLIATGAEHAALESKRAVTESKRADVAHQENQRLIKLLREHGIDPS